MVRLWYLACTNQAGQCTVYVYMDFECVIQTETSKWSSG
jgi:hypothetical protein